MSNLEYELSPVAKYRKGTEDDPFILITQQQKVINQRIQLSEIPSFKHKVLIDGYIEVQEKESDLSPIEYIVDYKEGIVQFHADAEGKTINVAFYGRGTHYVASSRIWVEQNNGEVTKTLKNLIDSGENALQGLGQLEGVLQETREAITSANQATENINNTNTTISNAETVRVQSENTRISNEEKRKAAETTRANEEGKRASAELVRETSETARNSKEKARVLAEESRVSAETNREDKEAERVANEFNRQSNETTRQEQETNRQESVANAIANVNEAVASVVHKGEYEPSATYSINNSVSYNGSSYICIQETIGNLPTDNTYWNLLASKGENGEGTIASVTSNTEDVIITGTQKDIIVGVNVGSGANQIVKRDSNGKITDVEAVNDSIEKLSTIVDGKVSSIVAKNKDITISRNKSDVTVGLNVGDGASQIVKRDFKGKIKDVEEVNAEIKSESYSTLTLTEGMSVVSSEHDTPVTIYNVQGRTLVNMLGRAGACESVDSLLINAYPQKTSVALDSTTKVQGSNSIKVKQSEANYGIVTHQLKGLASEKPYVFVAYFRSESASLPIHAELWGTAGAVFDRVITNKWTPQFFLLRSHTIYKELYIWAKSAGTFNIDAMRLYEITEGEYNALATMTSEQVAAKYPYVDGMTNVTNPYVEVTGENQLPPYVESGSLRSNSTYVAPYEWYTPANGNGDFTNVNFKVIPNTEYTISATLENALHGVVTTDYGTWVQGYTHDSKITFNSGSHTELSYIFKARDKSQASRVKDSMLVIGSEAKAFKPQQKSLWVVETQLAANPIDGSNADVLYTGDDGLPYVIEKWAKVTLDGSLPWVHDQNFSGFKSIRFNYKGMADVGDLLGLKIEKYDGTVIGRGTKSNSSDVIDIDPGGKWLFVSVANSDSGWGQDYVPTVAEIKAYFMGWKMAHNNGVTPYTTAGVATHGHKVWIPLAGFNGGNGIPVLPSSPSEIAVANGWKPYRLQYLKTTPTVVPVKNYELGGMLSTGNNLVNVGSGIVIREKANPKLYSPNGNYYINNTGVSGSLLKNKASNILKVYRNSSVDRLAKIEIDANAYGVQHVRFVSADFNTSAVYSITYTMLEPTLSAPISGKVASNLRGTLNDTVQDVADLQKQVNALTSIKADKGAPQWYTPTLLNNWVSVDYTVARYQKDDMGNVILDARVKNGVIGYSTPILILPAEYRPVRPIVFKVHCLPESITATVVVDSTGRVYCSYGSNTELNLYLMFKVD